MAVSCAPDQVFSREQAGWHRTPTLWQFQGRGESGRHASIGHAQWFWEALLWQRQHAYLARHIYGKLDKFLKSFRKHLDPEADAQEAEEDKRSSKSAWSAKRSRRTTTFSTIITVARLMKSRRRKEFCCGGICLVDCLWMGYVRHEI